jgi:hypothetical protein
MNRTHGLAPRVGRPREYDVWKRMRRRCSHDADGADRQNYFERGITVCDRWRNSFPNFYADMGPRPSPKHSIDRINNDGDYEPGNCRWATRNEQNRNTRQVRMITHNNQTKCLKDWCRELGLVYQTMRYRMRAGLTFERAAIAKRRHLSQ